MSVIVAQTKLEGYANLIEPVVKTEDEASMDPIPDKIKDPPVSDVFGECVINALPSAETMEDDKDFIGFPEVEIFDDRDFPFSSDDEKPLLECITKQTRSKAKEAAAKKNVMTKEKSPSVPKKRGRKPKTDTKKKQSRKVKISKETDLKDDEAALHSNDEMDGNNGDKLIDTSFGKRTSKEIDDFIAQWKQDLDCYLCNGTAPSMFALRQHFRKEHPNKRCYVLCCQRKLSRRHQLEEHIRVHVDPGAFKCNICGKCCTNRRTLSNHMYEQHTEQGQERSFECPICHKKFAKKPVWKRHMEIHEPNKDHICKECGKGFPTEQRRNVHERMVHNVERVCDQCGKIFRGIYTLRQHLLEHAGVERRKWPCDQCSAQLNTHTSLKRHKQVAHNDGKTVYICSECGKVAPSSVALMSHKKYVHQAPRKYKCTICEKAFKTNLVLREHMASHTGEDLYICPHCPKTFKVSSNMHHHRKKAHPIEWAEARLRKPMTASVDMNQVSQEIVM